MLRSFGFRAAAGFLLAVCGSLAAQEVLPPEPAAWVEVLAADPDAEALRPVVEEAVRYRLEGLGLAVRLRGSPAAASRPGRTPAPAPSILESAARGGAEFALECRYSGSGSRMSLQLSWYEVSTRLMTAAVDRKGRVDLVLDSLILDALDELLDRVRGRIEERVAAYGPRVRPAPAGGIRDGGSCRGRSGDFRRPAGPCRPGRAAPGCRSGASRRGPGPGNRGRNRGGAWD